MYIPPDYCTICENYIKGDSDLFIKGVKLLTPLQLLECMDTLTKYDTVDDMNTKYSLFDAFDIFRTALRPNKWPFNKNN